jgi:HAD superfamily hydrolase (TIGR01509 family)
VPLRALLFDFDGLLVDTETASFESWQEVYRAHGHELTLEMWAPTIGTIDGFDPWAQLEELAGPLEFEAVNAKRLAHELSLTEVEELRPGVIDYLVEAQERGVKTAIVSSSTRRWIDSHLTRLERVGDFHEIVTADGDTTRAKPAPTLYLEALDRLAVAAEDAVAFEDSPNGVRAAKAARIFVVAVPNDVTGALDLGEADLLVPSLAELPFEELTSKRWT